MTIANLRDYHQIKWGYQPLPRTLTPMEEIPILDAWVRQQDHRPWLRYSYRKFGSIGPGQDNEVADNEDPVSSIKLGLRNLERVLDMIPQINKPKRDNILLENLHQEAMQFWYEQMTHLVSMIGGVNVQYKSGSQENPKYVPIPRERQMEALEFLLGNAFQVPEWLSRPDYLADIGKSADDNKLLHFQLRVLSDFIDGQRMKRLEYMESANGYEGLTKEVISLVIAGLFSELEMVDIQITAYRKELQKAFITLSIEAIATKRNYRSYEVNYHMYSDHTKSILMSALMRVSKMIDSKIGKVKNEASKAHLILCLKEIDKLHS